MVDEIIKTLIILNIVLFFVGILVRVLNWLILNDFKPFQRKTNNITNFTIKINK